MTNPERLYAFTVRGAIYAGDTQAAVEASTAFGWGASPVAEYVLASVAAEQTAAALRGEAHEVAALRAECDALRSGEFVRAVAAERNAYREALEKVVALMVAGENWEPWEAKEVAKAALATKVVR